MTEHIALIARKLEYLGRMRVYLSYSQEQVAQIGAISWPTLMPEQHEALAAFRVRFSDFQEQLGKTMLAVAIEEEQPTAPFPAHAARDGLRAGYRC